MSNNPRECGGAWRNDEAVCLPRVDARDLCKDNGIERGEEGSSGGGREDGEGWERRGGEERGGAGEGGGYGCGVVDDCAGAGERRLCGEKGLAGQDQVWERDCGGHICRIVMLARW